MRSYFIVYNILKNEEKQTNDLSNISSSDGLQTINLTKLTWKKGLWAYVWEIILSHWDKKTCPPWVAAFPSKGPGLYNGKESTLITGMCALIDHPLFLTVGVYNYLLQSLDALTSCSRGL